MKPWAWLLAGVLAAAFGAAGVVYAGGDKGKTEEKVTLDQVPAAVKATILKEAGNNAITEIEKETKDGKVVYEAEWKVDGKEVEIKVAEDGTLLGKEVDGDDDD